MDNDTISRQAAIDAINEHLEFVTSGLGIDSEVKKIYKIAYNHTIDVISILPDIQLEQKIGRWIDDNCSECGQYVYHGDARNYCPNCGAKMDERG